MKLEQIQKDLLQAMQQEQFWHDRANFLRGQVSVLETNPPTPAPVPHRVTRRRFADVQNGDAPPAE